MLRSSNPSQVKILISYSILYTDLRLCYRANSQLADNWCNYQERHR